MYLIELVLVVVMIDFRWSHPSLNSSHGLVSHASILTVTDSKLMIPMHEKAPAPRNPS